MTRESSCSAKRRLCIRMSVRSFKTWMRIQNLSRTSKIFSPAAMTMMGKRRKLKSTYWNKEGNLLSSTMLWKRLRPLSRYPKRRKKRKSMKILLMNKVRYLNLPSETVLIISICLMESLLSLQKLMSSKKMVIRILRICQPMSCQTKGTLRKKRRERGSSSMFL